jgi:uncharacterized protein (DUF305 family)
MQELNAANLATEFIKLIIQHHPSAFGSHVPLSNEEEAKKAAQAISKLRSELIAQLTPQQ